MNQVTFPPTTKDNAEAIAAVKGYAVEIDQSGGIVAKGASDGIRYAAARAWSDMLARLLSAPKLKGDAA